MSDSVSFNSALSEHYPVLWNSGPREDAILANTTPIDGVLPPLKTHFSSNSSSNNAKEFQKKSCFEQQQQQQQQQISSSSFEINKTCSGGGRKSPPLLDEQSNTNSQGSDLDSKTSTTSPNSKSDFSRNSGDKNSLKYKDNHVMKGLNYANIGDFEAARLCYDVSILENPDRHSNIAFMLRSITDFFLKNTSSPVAIKRQQTSLSRAPKKNTIFSKLLAKIIALFEQNTATLETSEAVEEQARQFDEGLWKHVKAGELEEMKHLLSLRDPKEPGGYAYDAFTRGAAGETLLHLCFLYNGPEHQKIALYLMDEYPHLIDTIYEGEAFAGEVSLHIAIVKKDLLMVQALVERGALINGPRACGGFFQPNSKVYYGESPFSFAACTGDQSIVRYLLDHGADVNWRDSHGNTALHMMALYGNLKMYKFLREHSSPDETLINGMQLTPLVLAAKMGKKPLFEYLVRSTRETVWSYGPITCSSYSLAEIDSFAYRDWRRSLLKKQLLDYSDETEYENEAGKFSRSGALDMIIDQGHLNMLSIPLIHKVLNDKWTSFARKYFYMWLGGFLFYFAIFTVMIVLRPGPDDMRAHQLVEPKDYIRLVIEIILVTGAAMQMYMESQEIIREGWKDYFTGIGCQDHLLQWSFFICMITAVVFRITKQPGEIAVVSLAAVFGWCYLLYFARGFRSMGPFVIMIYEMLGGDFFKFLAIYQLFLIGFAQAFFVIFKGTDVYMFATLSQSFVSLFRMMFMEFEYGRLDDAAYPILAVLLFVIYAVVVAILMMNLLVAMMTRTFSDVNDEAEHRWRLQWATIILLIERKMTKKHRGSLRTGYLEPENKANNIKLWQFMVEEYDPLHIRNISEEEKMKKEEELKDNRKKSNEDRAPELPFNLRKSRRRFSLDNHSLLLRDNNASQINLTAC